MKRLFARAVFSAALASVSMALVVVTDTAAQAHPNASYVTVQAPFAGYWDRYGFSPPSSHPAYGSDWATDYYNSYVGQPGYWYAYQSNNQTYTATVIERTNACNGSSYTWAGYSYKVQLADSSGTLGYWRYVHVSPVNPSNGVVYYYSPYATWSNGTRIGWTYKYPNRGPSCWNVDYDNSVHWHIEGYNNHNYSCYFPWAAGSYLAAGSDGLGAVGSNVYSTGQPCW